MKNIVLVLLAALALIGSAAAWTDSETLYYQFQKQIYMQADDPSKLIAGTTSGAFFKQPMADLDPNCANVQNPFSYGDANGAVANKLVQANGNSPGSVIPDQTMTLTQTGGASITTKAPGADVAPEIVASMNTYQNMHFSGIYGAVSGDARGVMAEFESTGAVGVGSSNLLMGTESENSNYNDIGSVEVLDSDGDAIFTSGDVGVSAIGGFTQDKTYNGPMLISGSTNAWAGFGGAVLPDAGDKIQTNTGMLETTFATGSFPTLPLAFPPTPSW